MRAELLLLDAPRPLVPPTREQICRVRVGFQGVTVTTAQYGTFPVFGPETSSLNDMDLDAYFRQLRALGWTHVEFAVSWNYVEPGFAYPVPGRDLSQNLTELRRRILKALQAGFTGVLVFCAGDGESNTDRTYNDPQGWTYGRAWLMEHFQRIVAALDDLKRWIIFVPGYDGVWYGWRDAQAVRDWWTYARSIVGPDGYLGFEYAAGLCHLGDGAGTYFGAGQANDVWLQEFPIGPLPGTPPDQVWQIAKRMLGSNVYVRPPDEPASDDPRPITSYLAPGTPRGPYYYVGYEFDTFAWVRNRITAAQVDRDRAYLRALGCQTVC